MLPFPVVSWISRRVLLTLPVLFLTGLWGGVQAQAPVQWTLQCRLGLGSVGPCTNTAAFPYADAAAFHEAQLTAATQWLIGLGFAPPLISDADAQSLYARVVDAGGVVQPGLLAKYGLNAFGQGNITFNADELVYPGRPYAPSNPAQNDSIAVNNLGTPVHELFHAVQAGELAASAYEKAIADHRRWINEAAAEAVMSVWLDRHPPLAGQAAAYEEHLYDERLDDPSVTYEAWAFWRALGNELGAADDIEYLRGLYDPGLVSSLRRNDQDSGVDWVHQALTQYHGDGLYYYYPQVIARHLNDVAHYGSPQTVTLNDYTVVTINEQVEQLAAQAYLVEVQAPGTDLAGLSVELEEPHRSNLALHLIVDDQRYDHWNDGNEYNTYRHSVDPAQGPQTVLVRVANIAEDPSASAVVPYTIRFALEPSVPCSPSAMMGVVRDEYWDDQAELNTLFSAAQRSLLPFPLPGNGTVVTEFVRPAPEYLADFEPQAALHPAQGEFQISGLVQDGGVACTTPIGTNGMRAVIEGAESDPDAFEQQAEEAGRSLAERISQMSPEDLAQLREGGMEAMLRMGTPGQGGESMLGMGQDALEEAMGVGQDRPVLIQLFTPNAFIWQSDFVGANRAIEHAGLGAWQANAEAQVILELVDVGVGDLMERDEPYAARLFTWASGAPIRLYTRWEGDEEYTGNGAQRPTLSTLAFQGVREELQTTVMEGQVWITNLTGAEVRGRFELAGEALHNTVRTVFDVRNNAIVGDRVVDRTQDAGAIQIQGTFSAPSAVEFDRAGRVITRTFRVQ